MLSSRPLPKPVLLSEMLMREIATGRLVEGARLFPERQLAAELGVAVGTLRKALAILEEKGMLDRVQGSGNYVSSAAQAAGVYGFFRLERPEGGGLPSARVISVQRLRKEQDIPTLSRARTAQRIRRVRFLDETPIALEEIWLDGRFKKDLAPGELTDSLYYTYRETFGLVIAAATDQVSTAVVPNWASAPFELRSEQPCGFILRLSYDQNGDPAEFSRTWFDPRKANYTIRHQ
ncbi:MAG: GntR family transcriptional regulator [Pseudomonadota bacterium]